MTLVKEVLSFILLIMLSKFFVSGGRIINPIEFESVDERRSGIIYEQKNIAPTTWENLNYAPEYNPYIIPVYQELPPTTTAAASAEKITTPKLGLGNRNNFGDLPVNCVKKKMC